MNPFLLFVYFTLLLLLFLFFFQASGDCPLLLFQPTLSLLNDSYMITMRKSFDRWIPKNLSTPVLQVERFVLCNKLWFF